MSFFTTKIESKEFKKAMDGSNCKGVYCNVHIVEWLGLGNVWMLRPYCSTMVVVAYVRGVVWYVCEGGGRGGGTQGCR